MRTSFSPRQRALIYFLTSIAITDADSSEKMFTSHIYEKWGLRKGRPLATKKAGKVRKRKANESTVDTERLTAQLQHWTHGDNTYTSSHPTLEHHTAAGPDVSMLADPQTSHCRESFAATPRDSPPFSHAREPGFASDSPLVDHFDSIPPGWVDFLNSSRSTLPSAPQSTVYEAAQSDASSSSVAAAAVDHESQRSRPLREQRSVSDAPDPTAEEQSWTVIPSKSPSSVASSSVVSRATSAESRPSKSSQGSSHRAHSRVTLSSSASGSRRQTSPTGLARPLQSTMTLPVGSLRHLTAPDSILLPEKSMFFARHYISSTFSTGLWSLTQSTDASLLDTECIKLDHWFNDFNPALQFLAMKRVNEAFRVLQRSFAAMKEIIRPQDPRVVIYICQQAIRFIVYDNLGRNLAQTLLRYAAALSKDLFTAYHPLYIILDQMARMDHFEFAQSIRNLLDCYFDHLEPFVDQTSDAFGFIADLRGLTFSLLEACKIIGMYEAKPIVDRLVQRAQRLNHSTLQLRIEIASIYQRSRFFKEARATLEEIIDSEEAQKRPYERSYAYIMLLVTLRRMSVEPDVIIRVGYSLVDFLSQPMEFVNNFSKELFESQAHSTLVMGLGKLERDLRDAGRTDEAEKISARLASAMNETYGVEDPADDPQAAVLGSK
jgi:hypothetical protein